MKQFGSTSIPDVMIEEISEMTISEAVEKYPTIPYSVLKLIAKREPKKKGK